MPATRRGLWSWALYDWANSGFSTVIQTFVFAAYFTRQVAVDEAVGTAQWGNMVSAAALVVALGGPVLGAMTDQDGRRKRWIVLLTVVCAIATALLWSVRPAHGFVVRALVLVGVGTAATELASMLYNAMLPELAPADRIGRWSGWGWGLGYAGGLVCLVGALVLLGPLGRRWGLDGESAGPVRASFVLVAAWYLVFALPLFVFTHDRPRLAPPPGGALRAGLRQLGQSIRDVRRHALILRFLVARMLYTDGLATLFAFGGVFAAGTFGMTERQVLEFGIALNVTAGLGAAGFAWMDDQLGPKPTIVVALVGLIVAGTGMLVVRPLALFWAFGLALGLFVGPAQAASRTLMAELAPAALRNQMFGLYAFSGKATAFIGPLLVGWVTWWTGSQRAGMGTIIVLLALGLALLAWVPAGRRSPGSSRAFPL
jgi:MFS transporter, UMF1 family